MSTGWARVLATLAGAPATAACLAASFGRFLPVSKPWSAALGFHVFVPVWVVLACVLPLQRSGRRAWLLCALVALPALLVIGARRFGG
ncbi:MAG TPA: hypothetical protein VEQ58_03255 [Polyangiaceae bacterium]|nr:hypothetical protein [Polyangiaceae bacterium]